MNWTPKASVILSPCMIQIVRLAGVCVVAASTQVSYGQELRVVAETGVEPEAGGSGVSGVSGAFDGLSPWPVLDERGRAWFVASDESGYSVQVQSDGSLGTVARQFEPIPGSAGTFHWFSNRLFVTAGGTLGFVATGNDAPTSIYTVAAPGVAPVARVRSGDASDSGGTVSVLLSSLFDMLDDGTLVFRSQIFDAPQGAPQVGCFFAEGASHRSFATQGEALRSAPIEDVFNPKLADDGRVVFGAEVAPSKIAYGVFDGSAPSSVLSSPLSEGDRFAWQVPSQQMTTWEHAHAWSYTTARSVNSQGSIASVERFVGRHPDGWYDGSDAFGVFRIAQGPGGPLVEPLVWPMQEIPGQNIRVGGFGFPQINDAGQVAFLGSVARPSRGGGGWTLESGRSVLARTDGETTEWITWSNATIGQNDRIMVTVDNYAFNNNGDVLFLATVHKSSGGRRSVLSERKGVFLYTDETGIRELALVDDQIGSSTIVDLSIAGIADGLTEREDGLNDRGHAVFRAGLQEADGSTRYAILAWGLPPVCTADVTTTNTNPGDAGYGSADGTVDGNDLSYFAERWLAADPTAADVTTTNTNPGDAGYGSADGTVDGNDLSYFVERWLEGCS